MNGTKLCARLDAQLSISEAEALSQQEAPDWLKCWVPVGRFGWSRTEIGSISEEHLPLALAAGFFEPKMARGSGKVAALMNIVNRFAEVVRESGACGFSENSI